MRLTTCYRLARTNTFRLGSGKLFQKPKRKASEAGPEFGGNMQNWEKSLRRLALADEGYSFCQTDQSGADALVVAYLCPPGRFRDLFLYGIKPHVYIGVFFPEHWEKQFPCVREFATIPIKDLPQHPQWSAFAKAVAASDENPSASRYYYLYKKTCHSGNYGIQKNTFVEAILADSGGKVVLSPQQGDNLLHRYRDVAFSELYAFHRYVESTLERTGELRNLFGYPRRFRSLKHDIKEAYAFIPQSTVGCITNLAVSSMHQFILDAGVDWTILNNCHDSYLVQAPDSEILACAKKMQEFINIEMTAPRGEKFRMRSASSIGKNWGSYYAKKAETDKKEENLLGLVETKV